MFSQSFEQAKSLYSFKETFTKKQQEHTNKIAK
jgi:hypothetical protein